jgi:hypothetical protein
MRGSSKAHHSTRSLPVFFMVVFIIMSTLYTTGGV